MVRCENRLRGEGSRRASGTDTYVNTTDTSGLCNSVQKKSVQTSEVNSSKMLSDLEEKQKMLEIM